MIQVLVTPEDFPDDWTEFSDGVKEAIQDKELWADTTWPTVEFAVKFHPNEKFRSITINS